MKLVSRNLLPDDHLAVERLLAAMHDVWPYAIDQYRIKRMIAVLPTRELANHIVERLGK